MSVSPPLSSEVIAVSTSVEQELLMPRAGYIASAVVLFLIGFFGFFFNLIVIILMCKDKQFWTPLNFILFNLVCSDFSVSILGNPFTLASAVAKTWIFGHTMCVIYGFFMSLLGITSITTLTVLSFERYLMISRPLNAQRYLDRRGAVITIMGIWCYSIVITTPPLFGWGEYVNEAANISCSVNWESKTFGSTTYILFLFAFGLVIPVFVISFSYMNILRTMKNQRTMRTGGRVMKAESRVILMIAIMLIAFLIAWTPYAALALIIQFGDPNIVSSGMAVIPALIAKSSICYNPLIYVGLNTQLRTSWKTLLGFTHNDPSVDAAEPTKTHSKIILDTTAEKRRVTSLLVMAKDSYSTTKAQQLFQLFPPLSLPVRDNVSTVAPKRELSTVLQDNEVIETKLLNNSSCCNLIDAKVDDGCGYL